ncbi:MAG: hypothetical protein LBR80_10830 [Deltaproteobacteria bacterium]|jgi:ABC-type transport system involved in cytochrome c biogenesis ATPase subunit|nr:hypothetical protein [Deltaproteobacteria bacterium]
MGIRAREGDGGDAISSNALATGRHGLDVAGMTFSTVGGMALSVADLNGSGNTLLLKLLAWLVPAVSGRFSFSGKEAYPIAATDLPARLYMSWAILAPIFS